MGKDYSKPYLCVGGPLNGKYVRSTQFSDPPRKFEWPNGKWEPGVRPKEIILGPGGEFWEEGKEYVRYNNGSGRGSTHPMIWLHISLLPPRPKR